jgi:hypothetical protein
MIHTISIGHLSGFRCRVMGLVFQKQVIIIELRLPLCSKVLFNRSIHRSKL